nr:MFS transporter [Clostridiales bacterium]
MAIKKPGIVKGDLTDTTLNWKIANSYSLGKAAEGMSNSLRNSDIINYFLTNVLLINPIVAANIRLFSGIFSIVQDPFLGVWIDRTRRKSGKIRPFVCAVPFFIALFTIMFFISISSFSMPLKILYSVIALVGWDFSYSSYNLSMNALPVAMTKNSVERTKLFGLSHIFRSVAYYIPVALIQSVLYVPFFEKNKNIFYLCVAIFISLLVIICSRFT